MKSAFAWARSETHDYAGQSVAPNDPLQSVFKCPGIFSSALPRRDTCAHQVSRKRSPMLLTRGLTALAAQFIMLAFPPRLHPFKLTA